MARHEMNLYGNKVFGVTVSDLALERGYLDYKALANILEDCILNNTLRSETFGEWEMVSGTLKEAISQDFIISKYGYHILSEYTDEVVFYNERLNIYIWGVSHWGTSWEYVLTDIKLIPEGTDN